MNAEEIAKLLNSILRYDLEDTGSDYMSYFSLTPSSAGELLKAEDVAKAFGLKFDCFKGFSNE